MRLAFTSLCLIFLGAFSLTTQAQSTTIENGEYQLPHHDPAHPCISDDQYATIESRCARNIAALGLQNAGAQRSTAVPLAWPLRMANGLNDAGYYIISAYVDQDIASGSIKDWNCGTNTYDGHRGTDICTFPYPFYKMDNNEVEVISAADGIIIDKNDGEFDKNCVHSSAQANYVVVQHTDGTYANYFHMKKNSITTKAIGAHVTVGEYLGVVGSSGDANGPHLHFEVRTANNSSSYKDPYAGGCNSLNSTSWWAAQKPYTEPSILKTQIGTTDPILAQCPNTETPNAITCMAPGSSARIYTFLRNETAGMHVDVHIIGPTGNEVTSWTQNSTSDHYASIYGWARTMPTVQGTYTLQTVYNGITNNTTFEITSVQCATATGLEDAIAIPDLQVYPNPTNGKVTINGDGLDNGNYNITVRNTLGQTLLSDEVKIENNSIAQTVSLSQMPDGIYFLSIGNQGSTITRKIEKRN
ncbi:MAG: hypothetical protein JWO03_3838 [Bacteroidetes bacterium]|nr:hypothetical protein [Bacteroidota bacterium]